MSHRLDKALEVVDDKLKLLSAALKIDIKKSTKPIKDVKEQVEKLQSASKKIDELAKQQSSLVHLNNQMQETI